MSNSCPTCGTGGAYVGLSTVECLNETCVHFKEPAHETRPHIPDATWDLIPAYIKTLIDYQNKLLHGQLQWVREQLTPKSYTLGDCHTREEEEE